MKQKWQQLVLRIDALTLRERGILFLSVIVGVFALADTLFLSPAQLSYKQATQRFAAQNIELARLRNELGSVANPVDASKVVRNDIAAANLRLDAINQDIKTVAPLAEGGPAVEQALVQFLQRREGLTLVSTGTLKLNSVTPAGIDAAAASALSRRGLELRVSGSYADLVQYVQSLESALPTLRWGALEIKTARQTNELTLQVFVIGVPP